MHIRQLAAALAIVAAATFFSAPAAEAAPTIRFTKVYYDSPGVDTGSNASLSAEWARVKNFGSRARMLTSWTIRDAQGHVYTFPAFKLRPGYTVTLHTGKGTNTATNLYWGQSAYVWNNTGDRAILKNRAGTRIDRCSWAGSGSYVRC